MAGSSRREQVRRYLRLREREGLTYAELAEATGESESTLSWWAWRFRRESVPESRLEQSAFVELELSDDEAPAGAGVEVVLANGLRLALHSGFDAETLRRAVDALEPPC